MNNDETPKLYLANLHELGMYVHSVAVEYARQLDSGTYAKGEGKILRWSRDAVLKIGQFILHNVVLTEDSKDTCEDLSIEI